MDGLKETSPIFVITTLSQVVYVIRQSARSPDDILQIHSPYVLGRFSLVYVNSELFDVIKIN